MGGIPRPLRRCQVRHALHRAALRTPYKTETLPPDTGISELADDQVRREPELYNNINGLYLFNGHFAGVFSRLGPLPTISKDMQGMTAATIWVDCDLDGDAPEEA